MTAHGVDLIDENNAGRALFGLFKQIADTGSTHADEHLSKVGAGDGEERHTGLARDGFGQQGLTGSRRAHEQNSLGNTGAQRIELAGVLQELDDLLQFLLFLIGAGHIIKLLNNFIAQAIATATAEACAAAAKSGLSIQKLHQVISAGGVNSGIFQMTVGKMLEGKGDLTGMKFTINNAMKDLRYYTHFAESLPVSAIVGEAVHQSLVNASLMGYGDKFVPSLIEAQEKLNGISIVPKG